MARTLIGTGTTDSNGRLVIPYIGTGEGKLNLVAECGNLLSETCEIEDYLFCDYGVDGKKNNEWTVGSAITPSTDDTGTTLTVVNANNQTGYQVSTKPLDGDFEATLYCENAGTTNANKAIIGVTDGTARTIYRNSGNVFLKLRREDGVYSAYSSEDGETWSELTTNSNPLSGTVYFTIGIYNNTSTPVTLKYKDLKVIRI